MAYSYLVAVLTVFIAAYRMIQSYFRRQRGLRGIPGPWGVPFFGYLPFMNRRIHLTFTSLWKKYGDVYRITIGSRSVVVLNGQVTLRKALVGKSINFAGRPDFYTYKLVSRESLVGINDYSERYREAKIVLLKAFGNFHAEKRSELQKAAYHSVSQLIDIVKKANNEPFDPSPHMFPIICLIMGYVCWGEYFDVNDERVKHVLENAYEFGTAMAFGVLCDYFPCLRKVFDKKLCKLESLMAAKKAYSKKLTDVHVSTYNGQTMRDITDFFQKVEEEMPEEKKRILNLTKKDLLGLPGTMFGAGFATITITTKWAIIIAAKYPDIQTKLQVELDKVVGSERYPSFDDIETLPYTMAFIYEVYRYSSIAHIGFAHKTLCDTEINGHMLPKGTTVIANYYSAHRDPKYFANAEKFDPDRFLDDSGAINKSLVEKVIPYGLGMRRCGGEIVARLEIYTFIASLIHKCRIDESPDHPLDLDNYKTTVAIDPNPFKVIMRSRFNEW